MTYNVFGGTLSLTQSVNQTGITIERFSPMWFHCNDGSSCGQLVHMHNCIIAYTFLTRQNNSVQLGR